jgi:hypothetical protein
MPVNIQLSKNFKNRIMGFGSWVTKKKPNTENPVLPPQVRGVLVGLGRLELPTSPLSGVRSSHLSYRPMGFRNWWSWSGSNRRPPECKSGALPAELQPLNGRDRPYTISRPNDLIRGRLDARTFRTSRKAARIHSRTLSGDAGTGSPVSPKGPRRFMEWNGCLLLNFRRLHPRSLLERR